MIFENRAPRAIPAFRFARLEAAVFGALFLLGICAPFLRLLSHGTPGDAATEGRHLAPLPRLQLSSWQRFPPKFEAYYNDHFGFRPRLLKAGASIKKQLGLSSSDLVSIGDAGWLYYVGDGAKDDHRGLSRLSAAELNAWKNYLDRRQRFLAARGVRYLFVFAPDKQTVYPEHQSALEQTLRPGTRLDQLARYLHETSPVPVLDLRPVMLGHKPDGQLFWKTDTHWNSLGAYYGYAAVLHELQQWFPDLAPRSRIAEHPQPIRELNGDLARLLWQKEPEKFPSVHVWAQQVKQTALNYPALATSEERKPFHTTYPGSTRKALVYRDSFFNALLPSIGGHFASMDVVWRSDTNRLLDEEALRELLEKGHPDVFIEEMVERFAARTPDPEQVFGGPLHQSIAGARAIAGRR